MYGDQITIIETKWKILYSSFYGVEASLYQIERGISNNDWDSFARSGPLKQVPVPILI